MQVTILTWSTRGEVQPYVALGHELEARGHRVVIAVNENHVGWVRRTGLEVAPLPLDFHALVRGEAARAWLASGDTGKFLAWLSDQEHQKRDDIADALVGACAGAEVIVSGLLVSHRAAAIAAAMDVPFVRAFIYPIEPTSVYASPYLGNTVPRFSRDALRWRSHLMARSVFTTSQRAGAEHMRARLGLTALEGSPEDDMTRRAVPAIHLFDERILPRPHDWPPHAVLGGYCFLPPEVRERIGECGVGRPIKAWLDAGPEPVFFGFGSMPVLDSPGLLRTIERLCDRLEVRALVSAGWSDLSGIHGDNVLFVNDAIDYDAVLPRCRAAVHHGGAGTTATSLAAGLPTVVCSVFADQALWGDRVATLGVGATMPFQRMDEARLSEALRLALMDPTRARAQALGAELRASEGRRRSADAVLHGVESK